MGDKKLDKAIMWLSFLLALLILLLSNSLSWLNDVDYNKLLKIIPYKWQLTIWMMIIISLIFALVYTKYLSKPRQDKVFIPELKNKPEELKIQIQPIIEPQRKLRPSEIQHKLSYLSKEEKECLKKFLDADTRILIFLPSDEIAQGLQSIGILEFAPTLQKPFGYRISQIYWEHLKKRPDAIGL